MYGMTTGVEVNLIISQKKGIGLDFSHSPKRKPMQKEYVIKQKRNREMKFWVWIIEVCISFKHRWESTYMAKLKSADLPSDFYRFFYSSV